MDKVTKAIEFPSEAHDGMVRKKDKTPYILHPLEAAVIVGSMTDDRDVISAAVLHDVVEDTEITIEEIEETDVPADLKETAEKYLGENFGYRSNYFRFPGGYHPGA